MRIPARPLGAILLAAACLGCAGEPAPPLEPGTWRAWLDSPGGELPFGLELEYGDGRWSGRIVNGDERIEIERVDYREDRLVLGIDRYDAAVEATATAATKLDGRWTKTLPRGEVAELPFHATHGPAPRFVPSGGATTGESVEGRWSVRFAAEEDGAIAEFRQSAGAEVRGTFLTTTGDYRFLAGSFEGRRLRLSAFDGAHAFLFDARLLEDGTLAGDFWSRDGWHDRWTAQRDDGATLPPATQQVRWVDGLPLGELSFPDLDGIDRSLDDPAFAGRARILEIFGSWCPNCDDATRYLVDLHRRYGPRGLSIVGLAFEMSGDFDRDARQVRVYRDHHGIEYPLLIAGTSDKAEASRKFPLLDRIKSYPTTIFLDSGGRVHTVYSGFSGPATGEAWVELQALFERTIEELLEGP